VILETDRKMARTVEGDGYRADVQLGEMW